jgi:hypothetical protein
MSMPKIVALQMSPKVKYLDFLENGCSGLK